MKYDPGFVQPLSMADSIPIIGQCTAYFVTGTDIFGDCTGLYSPWWLCAAQLILYIISIFKAFSVCVTLTACISSD